MPLIVIYPREALHDLKYCFVRKMDKLSRYDVGDGICVAGLDELSGLELLVQHRRFFITPTGKQVLGQLECCLHAGHYAAIHEPSELLQAEALVAKYGFRPHVPQTSHPEMRT